MSRSRNMESRPRGWRLLAPTVALLVAAACPIASMGEAASTNALSLRVAIDLALTNNADLAAQSAQALAARERADVAKARRWPAVGLSGSFHENMDDTRLMAARYNGEQGVFASEYAEGGVTLRLPLYTGGRLSAEIRGADLLADSAQGRLARSRNELIFNVSSIFYAILAQRHVIESVAFSVETMEQHLKRVGELVDAQKAARVDALRTEVRRAELQQRLIEARNALAIQERALANLLGLETAPLPALDGKLELDEPEVCPAPADCIAAAMEQRADYRAARLDAEAAQSAVRAARGDRLPRVSLSGSYGYRWAVDPSEQPDGTDDAEDIARVGIVVELPIFEGGRLSAGVREAEANLTAARERVRDRRLRIRREVETALLNLSAARQRVDVAQSAVTQAEESLRIEREKYELGKGAIVDVLDAQSALLQTQTSYYRALADLNTAVAERNLAVGKEF